MRYLTYFLGVLFLSFSAVQLNDPDSVLWVFIYLAPAIISFLYTHKNINKNLLLALGLVYLIAAIYLFPPSVSEWISAEEKAKSMNMSLPGIEEARESMGLFICFVAIAFFWIKGREKI